jgi:hypothetical protein
VVADAAVKEPDAKDAMKDFGSGDEHPDQKGFEEHREERSSVNPRAD